MTLRSRPKYAPLKMYGQEYVATTWAMANMNMIIHDMEGTIEIGDTFKNPKFRVRSRLQTFDRVVSNPMWNQDWFKEEDYDADELDRFPQGAGFPGAQSADWGWAQHILASLNGNQKQAKIGPIPESWELVRLDHLATIERGKFSHRPRNAPEFYGGEIPFVQTGDVSRCDGRIRRYTQTLNE
jgi:N-6 DNA Methylase